MAEPCSRALRDPRPPARRRGAGARRRLRSPAGPAQPQVSAASSCATSTSRPAPPPGHGVRRHAGAHHQPRRGSRPEARRRAARRAVRQLARRDHDRDPPAAGHQEARGAAAPSDRRRAVDAGPRPRPRQGSGCYPRTTRCWSALGISDQPAASSPAGRRSTARSRSSCGCSTPPSATRSAGAAAQADRRGAAAVVDLGCGNAYLTFAAHRYLAACAGCRSRLVGVDVKEQSARAQQRRRRRRSASTPTSWTGPSATRARAAARGGARPARLRHRHRRGAGPGGRLAGRRWCWRRRAATTTSPRSCAAPAPAPYALLTRHGILRERFADTLTDAVRAGDAAAAGLPRGRRASSSRASTRRATRCSGRCAPGRPGRRRVREEYAALVAAWAVQPRLAELLERPATRERRSARSRVAVLRPLSGSPPRAPTAKRRRGVPFADPAIAESSGLVAAGGLV